MTRRNPPAKWVLPTVVDPPTSTCWSVPVPDDPFHKAAFLGALAALGSAYKWQDDPAHTAREVAKVWQNIADDLEKCQPTTNPTRIYESEDRMPIRVDCDCNVFVECCDGTEKQILTSQQVQDMIHGSSEGSPQPPAGGGCQTYNGNTVNGGHYPVPTAVNTGDVITLSSANGSTNGSESALWFCPDGNQFFAGACVDNQETNGGALMPAVPLGTLIVNIGGTWYDGSSPITVPSGVSNVMPEVTVNYGATSSVHGTVTFTVQVCNNETTTWSHTFDFTASTFGWTGTTQSTPSVWTPGSGWSGPSGNEDRCYAARSWSSARLITKVTATFSAGIPQGAWYICPNVLDVSCASTPATIGETELIFDFGAGESASSISLGTERTGTDTTFWGYLSKVVIEGIGTDPF